MYTICDVTDRHVLSRIHPAPHLAGNLAMQLADSVRLAGHTQRQDSHPVSIFIFS